MATILTVQPGQQRTLTVVATVAGLDPTRVTTAVWTPKGTDASVRWLPPDSVEGVALGFRDFTLRLTLAAVPGGAAEEVTYPFVIGCVAGEPSPVLPVMFVPKQESEVTPPPVISNVTVVAITASSAVVECDTDVLAEVRVEYGASFGTVTAWDTPAEPAHAIPLTGLASATTITYRVRARDALAQETVSPAGQFVTLAPPDTTAPTLTTISATAITSGSATIQTVANEAAQIRVEHGASFGTVTSWSAGYTTTPVMSLSGLTPSTLVTYRVRARDASGNESVSGSLTFTTLAQQAGGTWSIASDNTVMDAYDKSQDALGVWGLGQPGISIMSSWNSGAYDAVRNKLYVWGAGHADGAYNGVLQFDFATRLWSNLTLCSPNWIRQPGPYNSAYPDGTPAATHTYDTQEIVGNEYMVTWSGSRWFDANRGFYGWFLNLTNLTWRSVRVDNPPAGDQMTGDLGRNGDYDPVRQRWIMREDTSEYIAIDLATGAKTRPWPPDYSSKGVYDGYTTIIHKQARKLYTIGHRFFTPQEPGVFLELNLDGTGPAVSLTAAHFGATSAAAQAVMDAGGPGLAYDERRQLIVAWIGGGDVYEIDAPNRTVVKVTGTGVPGAVPGTIEAGGVHKRWRYRPGPDDFVLANRSNEPVYIYKAPTGGGVPPEPIPPAVLTATPPALRATDTLTASWTEISSPTVGDWLGLFVKGVASTPANRVNSWYLNGQPTRPATPIPVGSCAYPFPPAGIAEGLYELRLFRNDLYTAIAQDDVQILPPSGGPLTPFVVTAHPLRAFQYYVSHGAPGGGGKHGRIAYRPIDDKFYCVGGDWQSGADPGLGSGNSTTWRYHAPTDTWERVYPPPLAPPGPLNVGVRCGPAGDVQPSQPDEATWVWDPDNDLFHYIPGFFLANHAEWATQYCPGLSDGYHTAFTFNPNTLKWAGTYFTKPVDEWGGDTVAKSGWFDPVKHELGRFRAGPSCEFWNVATGAHRRLSVPFAGFIEQDQNVFDPVTRTAWVIDYNQKRLCGINIDTMAVRTFPCPAAYVWGNDPGHPETGSGDSNKSNVVFDPVRRVLVFLNSYAYGGETINFFTFDVATETWDTHPQYRTVSLPALVRAADDPVVPWDQSGVSDPQVARIALAGRARMTHRLPVTPLVGPEPRAGTTYLNANVVGYGNGVILAMSMRYSNSPWYFTIR